MTDRRGYPHQDAPNYLGVKRKFFEKHIRPRCKPVRCGTCLIFDRFDLDKAFDEYKAERLSKPGEKGEVKQWADQQPVSTGTRKAAGASTRFTVVTDFAEAAARISKKRKTG